MTVRDLSRAVCVGPVGDFPPGGRRIVRVGNTSVGVFDVDGRWYAIRNYCPHEGAELCRGKLTGTNIPVEQCGEYVWDREGLILRCPWHAWEFDLETGRALFDSKLRVRTYGVYEEDGSLWIETGETS